MKEYGNLHEEDHKGSNRVCRGGAWNSNARNCRAAYRNDAHPTNRNDNLGFRLARAHEMAGWPTPDPILFESVRSKRAANNVGRPVCQ